MERRTFRWKYDGADIETPFDVMGQGRPALLLPAFSSISTRREMHPLAHALASDLRSHCPDWPGFGQEASTVPKRLSLSPSLMLDFLRAFTEEALPEPFVAIGAGHSAAYLMTVAAEMPERFSQIVLVAPTWRGPLPTAMGNQRRRLWGRIRRLVDTPLIGPALFRLNVNRPVMRMMMKAHVYSDPAFLSGDLMAEKTAVTRRPGARFATSAFVTGELDLVRWPEPFLDLFSGAGLPSMLVLVGEASPRKSRADMDALVALPRLRSETIPGALAAHEEFPDAVADAVRRSLSFHAPGQIAKGGLKADAGTHAEQQRP